MKYNEIIDMPNIKTKERRKIYKGAYKKHGEDYGEIAYYILGNNYYDVFLYSTQFKVFASGGGRYEEGQNPSFALEEIKSNGGEFLGVETIEYPAPYFPVPHITKKKQVLIDKLEKNIKVSIDNRRKFEVDYIEPGNYQVYIMDFSEVDYATDIMMLNEKGMYRFRMMFNPYTEVAIGPMSAHIYLYENEDCGGILYSKLFVKLSVYDFPLVVKEVGEVTE